MKARFIRVVSVMMAILLMLSAFAGCSKDKPEQETSSTTETTTAETTTESTLPENVNPLTGKDDLSESSVNARPVAIIVENSPAARPQWGISTPDIVIEGVAEGGITRMMWVYADVEKIPEKVGPVRSARHDYVELASGMNAIFVHMGGSDGSKVGLTLGYQTIRNLGVNNIDGQTYLGKYFQRDTTRNTAIEHRAYTSGEYIRTAIADLGYSVKQKDSNWMPYSVIQEPGHYYESSPCYEITANFSSGYVHNFKYSNAENKYYNYLNGKVMTDGNNGASMAVENVIILYVPVSTLNTKEGHKEWNLEATNGEGWYAYGGEVIKVCWSKEGKSSPLKITTADGEELVINEGQTWMGFVPEANKSLTTITE